MSVRRYVTDMIWSTVDCLKSYDNRAQGGILHIAWRANIAVSRSFLC